MDKRKAHVPVKVNWREGEGEKRRSRRTLGPAFGVAENAELRVNLCKRLRGWKILTLIPRISLIYSIDINDDSSPDGSSWKSA
jgi:hypothetical protein